MMENTISINAQSAAGTLSALKLQLGSINGLFDANSRIYYIDYPVHNNIGDMLINIGTEQFFVDHRVPIHARYSILDIPNVTRWETDKNTTFLFHGGGNFGDLYPLHQDIRERLVERFPNVRIVFLPQSLFYSCEAEQQRSLKQIAKHPNFHILARDRESLDVLRAHGIVHASMMPDMAHQLWGTLATDAPPHQSEDIYFLRRDQEATAAPASLTELFSPRSVDWSDIVSLPHRVQARAIYYLLRAIGPILPGRLNAALWYSVRDKMINDAIVHFSGHDRVYTNRLHAMLLALLLGRDVVAFDNTYGKSSRYINAWFGTSAQYETA